MQKMYFHTIVIICSFILIFEEKMTAECNNYTENSQEASYETVLRFSTLETPEGALRKALSHEDEGTHKPRFNLKTYQRTHQASVGCIRPHASCLTFRDKYYVHQSET